MMEKSHEFWSSVSFRMSSWSIQMNSLMHMDRRQKNIIIIQKFTKKMINKNAPTPLLETTII